MAEGDEVNCSMYLDFWVLKKIRENGRLSLRYALNHELYYWVAIAVHKA